MSRWLWLFPLALPALAAACVPPSSSPAQAAAGAGLAVAAAGVNRAATGECWAMCRPGTTCDKVSGLCVEAGARSAGSSSHAVRSLAVPGAPDLPAGHEYEVPPDPASCACPPGSSCAPFHDGAASGPKPRAPSEPDAGPLACPPDGGVVTH